MIKFGITERGDVAFDDGWIEQMDSGKVAASILISKGLPSERGQMAMRRLCGRIVFHATTTGYGGTFVEPNVAPYDARLRDLSNFCFRNNFPSSHVVIRIDPIFPTAKGVTLAEDVCKRAAFYGFSRFRYSWLDVYRHVTERFADAGINLEDALGAKMVQKEVKSWWVDKFTVEMEKKGLVFESCAEANRHFCGCVSAKDFALCGLDPVEAKGKSQQRAACGCCGNKTELLTRKTRCPHKCLYCYWVD